MKLRNQTIDIARGLGILLVVLGHSKITLTEKSELFRVIYSFHVPLFFFLAGVFLRTDMPMGEIITQKARQLLKPYFIILFVVSCLDYAQNVLNGRASYSPSGYLLGIFYGTGETIKWVPLWFLPNLFLAYVLCNLYLKSQERVPDFLRILFGVLIPAFYFFGVFFIGLFAINSSSIPWIFHNNEYIGLPWGVDLVLITMPMVAVGFFFRKELQSMRFNALIMLLSTLSFVALHCFFDETIDLNLRVYGNVVICTFEVISGICLVMQMASLISQSNFVATALGDLGRNSLFILIFHAFFQERFFNMLFKYGLGFYPACWSAFFLSVGACIVTAKLIKCNRLLYNTIFL